MIADDRIARDRVDRLHRILAASQGERVVRGAARATGEADDDVRADDALAR